MNDEEARRAVDDALQGTEDHKDRHIFTQLGYGLAGVIDRNKHTSNEAHRDTRARVEGVNKLAISVSVAIVGPLLVAVFLIWFQ